MRIFNRILICSTGLLLAGLGLAFFLLPHKSFSEVENRSLTVWHPPTLRELTDGTFPQRLGQFYTDQFPLRATFVALKAETERALGRQENNGILFGKDGHLIPRPLSLTNETATENLRAVEALRRSIELPSSVLLVPHKADVLWAVLPRGTALTEAPQALLEESDALLPLAPLREAAEAGTYVWFRTDHHWTAEGAYLAYVQLAEQLGVTPYPRSDFSAETVSEEFFGTSFSKVGGIGGTADSVILLRYENDDRFTVTVEETGEVYRGFYRYDALAERDHYRVFLGGNYARLSVTDPTAEGRPRLLIVKDSYANALVPFLARHFDLELIDPRYMQKTADSLSAEGYDSLLILLGLDTLTTDRSLARWVAP